MKITPTKSGGQRLTGVIGPHAFDVEFDAAGAVVGGSLAAAPPRPAAAAVPRCTAGDRLVELLKAPESIMEAMWIIDPAPPGGCQDCRDLAARMNAMGLEWCTANVQQIVNGIEANARKRNAKVFSRAAASEIVIQAINSTRDDLKGQ